MTQRPDEPRSFGHDAAPGPLETGHEFRTEREVADRDPGDATERLDPDTPGVTSVAGATDEDSGDDNEQRDARRLQGEAAEREDAEPTDLDPTRADAQISERGLPRSDGL